MIPTFVALVLQAFLGWSSGGQVYAVLTNTTIDDTDLQHWSYGTLQQGGWVSVTAQTPCANCSAQPDPTKVFNQSWHDGYRTTGAFAFQGVLLRASSGSVVWFVTYCRRRVSGLYLRSRLVRRFQCDVRKGEPTP
jgi:hypothetical protein